MLDSYSSQLSCSKFTLERTIPLIYLSHLLRENTGDFEYVLNYRCGGCSKTSQCWFRFAEVEFGRPRGVPYVLQVGFQTKKRLDGFFWGDPFHRL